MERETEPEVWPIKLRVQLMLYCRRRGEARLLERSFVVSCATREAVLYFRTKLREFLSEMDGTILDLEG